MFCDKQRLKIKNKNLSLIQLTPEGVKLILSNARILNDDIIQNKIERLSCNLMYHKRCKLLYQKKAIVIVTPKESCHVRDNYKESFNVIVKKVQEKVIDAKEILYMKPLFDEYKTELYNFLPEISSHMKMGYLEKRLRDQFKQNIQITKLKTKNQLTLIYNSDVEIPEMNIMFHSKMQKNFDPM